MIDLYRLNLKYNMFGGMVIPHQPEIEILLYGILAAEALCTLQKYGTYFYDRYFFQKKADEMKRRIMDSHAGYIHDTGCEDEATEAQIRNKWKDKFGNTLWTSLYKEEPIICIDGHGGLVLEDSDVRKKAGLRPHNPDETPLVIKVPEKTQLISYTRSGTTLINTNRLPDRAVRPTLRPTTQRTRYGNSIMEDIKNTASNPNNENFYLLENDGIKRKLPYIYSPILNQVNGRFTADRNQVSVSCQKLYREDDIINNIEIDFYDSTGFFAKNGTGIFIYNSKISLDDYLIKLDSIDLKKLCNEDIILLRMMINAKTEKLPSSQPDRFNFKFGITTGDTSIYNIMNIIQNGTYYINSCKNGTESQVELARQISITRTEPRQ